MDSYELKKRFTFGVDSKSNAGGKPVSFLNDQNIVYIADGTIIVQDLHTNEQHHVECASHDGANGFENELQILGIDACDDVLVSIEESRFEPYSLYVTIRQCGKNKSFWNSIDCMKRFQIDIDEKIIAEKKPIRSRQQVIPISIHKETSLVASLLQISEDQFSLLCWGYEHGLLLSIDNFVENEADGNADNGSRTCTDPPLGSDENFYISFHHKENIICIQSSKRFWLYRLVPETTKQDKWSSRLINFPIHDDTLNEEYGDLTCHCWVKDSETRIVFGTKNGKLLVTDEGSIITSIDVGFSIESLLNHNSSFIVGGPDCVCQQYEEEPESINGSEGTNNVPQFLCKNAFFVKDTSSFDKDILLQSMVISPSLDKICIYLSHVNEIFMLDLKQCAEINGEGFVQVACGPGRIHSISSCIQKSIILTAGSDGAVRCWDYVRGKQLFCKYFTDALLSVSLHQSGLHAVVSFKDEVRCVHILIDDMKTFWQKRMQRKLCVGSVLSNGCHKFAIAYDVCIDVYDFYSGKITHEMKGHHKITQLRWRHGDGEILTMDESGMLRRWNVQHGALLAETSQFKAYTNTYFNLVSREEMWMIADGSVHILSQSSLETKHIGNRIEEQYLKIWCPSQVAVNEDSSFVLLLSHVSKDQKNDISPTSLRLCKVPFSGYADFAQYHSFHCVQLHSEIIFCASESSLYIMQLEDKAQINRTLITQISLSGENASKNRLGHNLVSEIYMEERNSIVNDLTSVLSELKADHEYKINLMRMKNEDEIFKLEEKLREAEFNEKDESQLVSNEKKRIMTRFEQEMNSLTNDHQQQILCIQNEHSIKIQKLFGQHKVQIDNWKKQLESLTNQKQELIAEKEKGLKQLEITQTNLLNERQLMTKLLSDDINTLQLELVERRDQVEDDIDTFIEDQKRHQESRLASERQATLKVVGENGILNKRTQALVQNIEDQKEAIKHLLFKEESDKDEIKALEKSIEHLLTLKKQKKKIYASKEKTNLRFKMRKEELGKLSILDDKLHTLKETLENDTVITNLKTKVEEKERLLAIYETEHTGIEKLLAFRGHEIREKHESLSKQSAKYVSLEGHLSTLRKELSFFIELINKPEALMQKLIERKCDESVQSTKRNNCQQVINNDSTAVEYEIENLTTESKDLSSLLLEQHKNDSEELHSLRAQNQVLLGTIRNIMEENVKAKKRLSKVIM